MPRIAGITTQKDARGNITHVTFNIKKHEAVITPVLQQLGVLEKSSFMKEFEAGVSIEDSRKRAHAKIDGLWSE